MQEGSIKLEYPPPQREKSAAEQQPACTPLLSSPSLATMARLAAFAIFVLIALLTPQASASRYHYPAWRYPYPATYKLKQFVKHYHKTLGSCNIWRIRKLYARDFVTFRANGLSGILSGELDGYRRFCQAFGKVKFTPVEIVRVSPLVVFVRVRADSPKFTAGPVSYSVAMKLGKHPWRKYGFVLKRNVITAGADTFAKAVAAKP